MQYLGVPYTGTGETSFFGAGSSEWQPRREYGLKDARLDLPVTIRRTYLAIGA